MVPAVIQEFLESEMAPAGRHAERKADRRMLSYRSGYYARILMTRVGKLGLRVPQDRNGPFCNEIFERYQHSEKVGEQRLGLRHCWKRKALV